MFKKVSIFLAAVMLFALCAGLAFAADDVLTYGYRGSQAANNYFPPTAGATTFGISYGRSLVDGLVSGKAQGAPTDVFINAGGFGDALIYGYYNVRGDYADLFTLTNTANYGVRARIRFIEAKNSCELLDFDICLSAHDVWTGVILKGSNKAGVLFSPVDTDTPVDYGDRRGKLNGIFQTKFPDGVGFRFGSDNPNCSILADDTLEGYFIVIAENQLVESTTKGPIHPASGALCGQKFLDKVAGNYLNDSDPLLGVDNVLFGQNYLINVQSGKTFAYNATAIGDFTNVAFPQDPTDNTPNLGSGAPNANELNFVLTKNVVATNYWDLGTGTEIIVNFPTKRITQGPGAADDIFDDPRVLITAFDDKEQSRTTVCQFSPCPRGTDVSLPNEVNVVNINKASIFDSGVEVPITVDFAYGWIAIDLVNASTSLPTPEHMIANPNTVVPGSIPIANNGITYTSHGLPAIGYVVNSFGDAFEGGVQWMLPLFNTTAVTTVP